MSTFLLDANVLIALAWPVHVYHAAVRAWFESKGHKSWATCAMTQNAFVRISSNPSIIKDAVRPEQALEMLKIMTRDAGHRFWPDDVSMGEPGFSFSTTLTGYRQVTDAYLLALAVRHKAVMATLDRGLLALGGSSTRVEWIGAK